VFWRGVGGWGWDGVKACIFNWRDESPGAVG